MVEGNKAQQSPATFRKIGYYAENTHRKTEYTRTSVYDKPYSVIAHTRLDLSEMQFVSGEA